MKKMLLIILVSSLTLTMTFAQTAVNFTVNDCNGNSTDLFSQLDSGKVVCMLWVMPCGACISVAENVNTVVQAYASSNPGKVLFYLVDDYGNTSCSTLSDWAGTNELDITACFSSAGIAMSDYGSDAMQKTVVLGGSSHTVYFTDDGSISTSNMQTAINSALSTSAIIENHKNNFQLNVYPNPATDKLYLSYSLTEINSVTLEIVNMLGEKLRTITNENQKTGLNEINIDVADFKNGFYLLKISSENTEQVVKFNVLH